jgi:hypothetical protein
MYSKAFTYQFAMSPRKISTQLQQKYLVLTVVEFLWEFLSCNWQTHATSSPHSPYMLADGEIILFSIFSMLDVIILL